MDQRKYPRRQEETPIKVSLIPGPTHTSHAVQEVNVMTRDISLSGMRIRTPDILPVHGHLRIELQLTDPPRAFILTGIVRQVVHDYATDMYEVGIEFTDPPPDLHRTLLKHFRIQDENDPYT
jgi:c-di-GMP-binding flagellar brake protein YcgR